MLNVVGELYNIFSNTNSLFPYFRVCPTVFKGFFSCFFSHSAIPFPLSVRLFLSICSFAINQTHSFTKINAIKLQINRSKQILSHFYLYFYFIGCYENSHQQVRQTNRYQCKKHQMFQFSSQFAERLITASYWCTVCELIIQSTTCHSVHYVPHASLVDAYLEIRTQPTLFTLALVVWSGLSLDLANLGNANQWFLR